LSDELSATGLNKTADFIEAAEESYKTYDDTKPYFEDEIFIVGNEKKVKEENIGKFGKALPTFSNVFPSLANAWFRVNFYSNKAFECRKKKAS
ncbi:22359_t:CDS:2, partial [Entrophospora sp. SA101]